MNQLQDLEVLEVLELPAIHPSRCKYVDIMLYQKKKVKPTHLLSGTFISSTKQKISSFAEAMNVVRKELSRLRVDGEHWHKHNTRVVAVGISHCSQFNWFLAEVAEHSPVKNFYTG